MMRKPTGHKERYSIKSEVSRVDTNDGTSARTRPFSFDEIMHKRKKKKQSESVEDQRVVSETVYDRVESDRHRRRDIVDTDEQHASKEPLKEVSRTKEKIVESEYRESYNAHRRSKVDDDSAKDSRKERGVHEKRKNHDRSTDDFDPEHLRRHGKDYAVKDRDRGKSEHVSKRAQNVYDDSGKKHESRKWHDPPTSEKKQQKKTTSESRHDDLKSRSKRSRSREHERDKSKRSKSPSPKGQKQRYHDAREPAELSSHSAKDGKRVSSNGSDNKIKRHETSSSGLGGYSPRKRRSEASVKTPLNNRSPEKKNAGWDSPPVKMESSLPSLNKTEPSNRHEASSVGHPITPIIPKPTFGVISSITSTMNVSVDSVQLTQATRPQRRIYVENLPSSASEAAVMQWLTGYLRPFGLTHVQSTSPCISCIVNKEKGQALVEFLTPEDASAALNLDGKSFSGNIVKIRRPKDYIEAKASTGVSEKPVAGAVPVKNIVEDSPNKMFIGGISKAITSEMLKEIASAFGPLKAYHFEDNAHLQSSCAFVEYADQSVTVKACVGLNGMKLGGQVLTVTQATPDASVVGNHGDQPFYGTPVHARPLLEKPTQVLKLNNVLDPHSLPSLSESELEEILEDIRLECARFGVVKSVNIIKQTEMPTSSETVEVIREASPMVDEATKEASPMVDKATKEASPMVDGATKEASPMVVGATKEASPMVDEATKEASAMVDGATKEAGLMPDEASKEASSMADEASKEASSMADEASKEASSMADEVTKEATSMVDEVTERSCSDKLQQHKEPVDEYNSHTEPVKLNGVGGIVGNKHENETGKYETCDHLETENRSLKVEPHDSKKNISDLIDAFEVGCVLVEYKRTEASSMAAHCLHGRVFDGRSVSVEYVAYDVYRTRFQK